MTQRLQQALKLLQVPTLELEQILRHELQGNPLLEEIDPDDELEDEARREDEVAALDEDAREKTQDPQDEDRDWGTAGKRASAVWPTRTATTRKRNSNGPRSTSPRGRRP
jgi:DNA-directed RNA polymerase specialized sigma54-like protein